MINKRKVRLMTRTAMYENMSVPMILTRPNTINQIMSDFICGPPR